MTTEMTTELITIDPVTGEKTCKSGRRTEIFLHDENVGTIKDDGRVVYCVDGTWIYEPPGRAILSRNYPAIAPVGV